MLRQRLTAGLSEIRLDIEGSSLGKLRVGLALTIATVVAVATGWPPADMVQRGLFLVLGALPAAAVGGGLIVGELIHARTDRRGRERADDREVRALRDRIAAETGGTIRRTVPDVPLRALSRHELAAREAAARSRGRPQRRLVARHRTHAPWRSGVLGLR